MARASLLRADYELHQRGRLFGLWNRNVGVAERAARSVPPHGDRWGQHPRLVDSVHGPRALRVWECFSYSPVGNRCARGDAHARRAARSGRDRRLATRCDAAALGLRRLFASSCCRHGSRHCRQLVLRCRSSVNESGRPLWRSPAGGVKNGGSPNRPEFRASEPGGCEFVR
jgi:hypothetical protein